MCDKRAAVTARSGSRRMRLTNAAVRQRDLPLHGPGTPMPTTLITGANRGIGLELARQTAESGGRVLAGCRHLGEADKLQALAAEFPDLIALLSIDVTDDTGIAASKARISATPVDILINCAGVIGPDRQSALDMDYAGFADTIAVNTIGPLRVTRAFLPNLQVAKAAKVVTISSIMGSLASAGPDRLAYRASKAAINMVMRGLAAELQPLGIAALTVHPGWVRTDMGGASAPVAPEDSAAGILAQIAALTLAGTGRFLDYLGKPVAW